MQGNRTWVVGRSPWIVVGGEREKDSLGSKDVSPNDSEPDSASLRLNGGGQTAKGVEASSRQGRNGHVHLSGRPGWLGRARVERSVKEPGRPGVVPSTV